MATEFVRRPRIQLQNPGNWGEVAEPPTPWHPLAELLEQFEGDLWPNRQEQVMLRLFTSRTGDTPLHCPLSFQIFCRPCQTCSINEEGHAITEGKAVSMTCHGMPRQEFLAAHGGWGGGGGCGRVVPLPLTFK